MALWDKISSTGNVEDRRSFAPGLTLGGGLVSIAFVVVFGLLSGKSSTSILQDVLNQASGSSNSQLVTNGGGVTDPNDPYVQFTSKVLGSTNDTWKAQLSALNKTYSEPRLVLFRSATVGLWGSNLQCWAALLSGGQHDISRRNVF